MRLLVILSLFALACGSSGSDTPSSSGTGGNTTTCLPVNADCTSTPNGCCSGICESKVGDPAHHAFCAAACVSDSDCASGCCATLVNTGMRACAGRGFCPETCMPANTACTTSDDCCGGNICVAPSFTCAAVCTIGSQCASGCCAALADGTAAVCSNPVYCP